MREGERSQELEACPGGSSPVHPRGRARHVGRDGRPKAITQGVGHEELWSMLTRTSG